MKYLILIFIYVLFLGKIIGQTQNYYSNDTLDQNIRYGLCYEDDHYFLTHVGEWSIPSGSLLYGTEGYDCYLIRLDSSLKMIDSLLFEPMDGFLLNITKVMILDDTIFAVGRAIKPDNSDEQVFFGRYTINFQLIDYSFFGDTTQIEIMSDFILNDKENFVVSAKVTTVDFEQKYFILFECDKQGDLLQCLEDTSWHLQGANVIQLPTSKSYHFTCQFSISIYDSSFVHQNTVFPNFYNQFIYMYKNAYYENDLYFMGGIAAQGYINKGNISKEVQETYIDITYYLVDEQAKTVDSGYIYLPDTVDFCNGLDYKSNGTFCYGGTHNAIVGPGSISGFEDNDRWLVVKSMNYKTQSENWFFRYGGDANYYMYGLYLTDENECVIYSTRYDWHNTDELERDILVMKIDSTGTLVGNNYSTAMVQFCKIYPNPGTNNLNIEAINLEGEFELFNMNGVQVFNKPYAGSTTTINTSFLKPGIYFYKLTDKFGEKINVGKWIKQ